MSSDEFSDIIEYDGDSSGVEKENKCILIKPRKKNEIGAVCSNRSLCTR